MQALEELPANVDSWGNGRSGGTSCWPTGSPISRAPDQRDGGWSDEGARVRPEECLNLGILNARGACVRRFSFEGALFRG